MYALGQVLYYAAVLESHGHDSVNKQIMLFGVSRQRGNMFKIFEDLCACPGRSLPAPACIARPRARSRSRSRSLSLSAGSSLYLGSPVLLRDAERGRCGAGERLEIQVLYAGHVYPNWAPAWIM